jgi:hypothetical protein
LTFPQKNAENARFQFFAECPRCRCRDTLQKVGFGVFAKIFSKNIVIPSREIPFFGEAPNSFGRLLPNSVSPVFFG